MKVKANNYEVITKVGNVRPLTDFSIRIMPTKGKGHFIQLMEMKIYHGKRQWRPRGPAEPFQIKSKTSYLEMLFYIFKRNGMKLMEKKND